MLGLFKTKRCRIHDHDLASDTVPVRYGLTRFPDNFLKAQRTQFPHAKTFVLGGCRVGTKQSQDILFCPKCREAESQWRVENPEYDTRSAVHVAVQSHRRDLPDSLGKRILRQSALELPEQREQFQWIVYRMSLEETVVYHSRDKTYAFPWGATNEQVFDDVQALSEHLNSRFGQIG